MTDNHHRTSPGMFSFLRSLIGQSSNPSETNDNEQGHSLQGRSTDNPSHDVEMSSNGVNSGTSTGLTTPTTVINEPRSARDDDGPQDSLDTDSSSDELEMLGDTRMRPSSTSTNTSRFPYLGSRRSHRRARVEEDEGDHERDRRHPSQRAANLFRRVVGTNQRGGNVVGPFEPQHVP